MSNNVVVAVTGASGAIYAVRLVEVLMAAGRTVHLTISAAAAHVLRHELGLKIDLENFDPKQLLPDPDSQPSDSVLSKMKPTSSESFALSSVLGEAEFKQGDLIYHHYQDFSAGIASGSFLTEGMVICPCSMGTLGTIAAGSGSNLIHRAADVHLKERRKLIIVARETPLGLIPLENMVRLTQAGATILPAAPGFYHNPVTIHDLVDFISGRICDHLEIRHEIHQRWGK
ncbi:UbiX family flavin prenyltransferase [Gimesia chilikensis]|jgi:4-hydroxy-3-polyprenylbenzoate decarboxylase|uniref:Flavin prenyltransferase UbiX n=1 Tax=Gimesia chilikensis TaxID=2605989 RepID=A0A517W7S8_9PLAN|nr:flavin prenyltransferase UbiX [Gimesia chilikensis]MBN73459.1 3-octaprenyl-4-hydroxybenzoate carboxy-lyase [Gimesia sp.]QDU01298.1 putative aromatic acid decarboxylase [Gimesia chilikensis]